MQQMTRRHHRARVVRDALRVGVMEGVWYDGVLPSEEELATQFNVGRNVIREALSLLVGEGYLERRQGIGTRPRSRVHLFGRDRLRSLGEIREGHRTTVIQWEHQRASPLHAMSLGVQPDAEIILFERLTSTSEPLVLWSHVLRADLNLEPPERAAIRIAGIYDYLESQGIALSHSTVRTSAIPADRGLAELLGVEPGAPLLAEYQTLWQPNGTAACISTGYFRGDRFSLTNEIQR
ncbi:GntR family transcriptional regulator [Nesterenkonia alba]|uniref:GntR family transcriptional regulator n=1 Tax=Nesterenkonia alba TaxID=515814 RepID=UPI0006874CE5|nr:GntR family transcriptional regulator [Nesterenkonia alba]